MSISANKEKILAQIEQAKARVAAVNSKDPSTMTEKQLAAAQQKAAREQTIAELKAVEEAKIAANPMRDYPETLRQLLGESEDARATKAAAYKQQLVDRGLLPVTDTASVAVAAPKSVDAAPPTVAAPIASKVMVDELSAAPTYTADVEARRTDVPVTQTGAQGSFLDPITNVLLGALPAGGLAFPAGITAADRLVSSISDGIASLFKGDRDNVPQPAPPDPTPDPVVDPGPVVVPTQVINPTQGGDDKAENSTNPIFKPTQGGSSTGPTDNTSKSTASGASSSSLVATPVVSSPITADFADQNTASSQNSVVNRVQSQATSSAQETITSQGSTVAVSPSITIDLSDSYASSSSLAQNTAIWPYVLGLAGICGAALIWKRWQKREQEGYE